MNGFICQRSSNDAVQRICAAGAPRYRGRDVTVRYTVEPLDLRSYWDEGSRTYYSVVRLSDMTVLAMPAQHPVFDPQIKGAEGYVVPVGFVVVAHEFAGARESCCIYANPAGVNLLPAPTPELSEDEKVVLRCMGYKSSYGGISDFRAHEAIHKYHLTRARVEAARASLRQKKLLNAANALTTEGKNTRLQLGLWSQ